MTHTLTSKQKARFFVAQSNTACRRCQNFGSFSCPAFKKAVDEDGIDPNHLISAIEDDQKGVNLDPCSKA